MRIMYRGIQQTQDTLSGKARIKGRRVAVQLILIQIQNGMSIENAARAYDITEEQVKDALGYALKCVKHFDP